MRLQTIFAILLLSFCSLSAQNFSGGFAFPLSVLDSTTGDFLPSFPKQAITNAQKVSTASDGTFRVDGQPVRFWGVNLAAAANFPEKSDVPRLVGRMRKMGINLVRLHHLDNPAWYGSNSSILTNNGNTRTINTVAQDKLDFLIAECKKNGIYINLNLNVSRTFQAGDGVVAADSLQDFAKALTLFDPRMLFLQKEFANQMLNHVNPYTGLALADDPVLAMMETNNENTLYGYWRGDHLTTFDKGGLLPYFYDSFLDEAWHTWLFEKYKGSSRKMADAWNESLVPANFGEILANPGFETGILGPDWFIFSQNGGAATATVTSNNPDEGTYSATIQATALGANNYDIQCMQTGFSLKKDTTYTLYFRAKANTTAQLTALVQKDATPYTTYGAEIFDLTTEWKTFEVLVNATETLNGLAKVAFFPENIATYQIDAVSLRPLYQAPSAYLGFDQVQNGGFEIGNTIPWELELHDVAAGTFTATTTAPQTGNYAGVLNITAVTGTDWHIQLKNVGGTIEKDSSYQLRFYAKSAAAGAEISVTLMQDVAPFNWYGGTTLQLTAAWQEYSFSLTAPEDNVGNLRIAFSPLQNTGQFYFDAVRFGKPVATGLLPGENLEENSVKRVLYTERTQFSDTRIGDMAAFYTHLEKSHLETMYAYIKNDIGVSVPVTGSNALVGPQDVFRHEHMDYIDDHAYWNHPNFPNSDFDPYNFSIENTPMVKNSYFEAISTLIAGQSIATKPYTISEYNHAAPNRYRTEMVPAMAAYSAFHGVDGIMFFEYETGFDWTTNAVDGFFSLNQDHSVMALFPSAAYAYRKGYIQEDPNPYVVNLRPEWIFRNHKVDNAGRWGSYHPFSPTVGLEHAVHTGTFSNPDDPDFSVLPAAATGSTYTTATNETKLNHAIGILTTATPKYASITGFLQDAPNTVAGDLELVSGDNFGALTWISLSDTTLQQSPKSLLSLASVQQNTGMVWKGTTGLSSWGQAPSILLPLQVNLRLHLMANEICVYPLNQSGDTVANCTRYLPTTAGVFDLSLDQSVEKTLWYGIKASFNTTKTTAPQCFDLQLMPNPTGDKIRSSLDLKTSSQVVLQILNAQGQLVFSKNYGQLPSGKTILEADLSNLASGLYFCVFQAEGQRLVRKVEKY